MVPCESRRQISRGHKLPVSQFKLPVLSLPVRSGPARTVLSPPMRTKAGYKIARKAGIKYSRLPIRVLTTLLEDLIYKLESKLSRETQALSLQD